MTKKGILQRAGTKKYWLLDQCRAKGVLGQVEKNESGDCIYTQENLLAFKKYLKEKGK